MRAPAWCWLALVAAVVSAPAGEGVSGAAPAPAPQRPSAGRVPAAQGPAAAEHPHAAWRLVDLASGRTLDEGRSEILALALSPGSIIKLATLIAALEVGVITARTRMACPGSADVAGRRVVCLHPRMRRPLSAAEALAHSCNVFFAGVGLRLSRARLDGVLAELGLPPSPPRASPALAAAGIEASPVPPEILLRVIARVVSDPPAVNMRAPTRAAVMSGLRGAASVGTAAAFEARGVRALAKTGTALSPGGGQHGLVVAAWPAARPTRVAVVVVAGESGADAADLAARLAREGRLPPAAAVAQPTGASVSEAARADVPGPRRPESTPGPASVPAESPHAVPAPVPTAPPRPARDARPAAEPPPLAVRVGYARGNAYVTQGLPLEEYVAHVIAGEAAPRSTPAALEALAITVRTFALANRGRHARDGFDLCDLTHCQVLRPPYDAARAAAAATSGQVLAWQGAPAQVFYTASCGGRTERPSHVWPAAGDPPFLPSRPDAGCGGEPQWSADVAAPDLVRALTVAGYRGTALTDMRVLRRSDSGRVTALRVTGLTPEEISGQDLRMAVGRTLGWQHVKSTQFELSRTGSGYRFRGRGFGHGVGLCVIGATRRSAEGWSRAQLLDAYFPGLEMTAVADLRDPSRRTTDIVPAAAAVAGGEARTIEPALPRSSKRPAAAAPAPMRSPVLTTRVRLLLPAQDEPQRPTLTTLAAALLGTVSARAGRSGPREVHVVFHPNSGAFQRATRQPWWSAGSTRGSRIDLQPISVLRERGTLEETLAREFGHLVTAPVVRGRPLWVAEGAAMYVAGLIDVAAPDVVAARGAALSCPSDAELRNPETPAAMKDAYGRARACFERALGSGQRWEEVR